MIRIAVCDDDRQMAYRIRDMAFQFFRGKGIETKITCFADGAELLEYDDPTDILFLDIRMGHMDGMETAARLRSRKFGGYLIFITVLEEMVFRSFEVGAFDYLLKPFQRERFEKTMERLFLSMQNAGESNLLIRRGRESDIVPFADIVYCEVIDRKVYLHLKSEKVIDYYERIEDLAARLDGRFFRCHRSYLINLNYLKSYRKGTAYLEGGGEIPVSRLRSREFSDVIMQYMKEWRY